MSFWELPGPRRFSDQVVGDLRAGTTVVVVAPPNMPPLRRELQLRIGADYAWRDIDVDDGCVDGATPLAVLSDVVGQRLAGVSALCESSHFGEYLFAVRGIDRARWQSWRPLLLEFVQAARNAGGERPLMLVEIDAGFDLDLAAEASLSTHIYRGVVDRLDCAVAASESARDRGLDPLRHELTVALAAEIALFDPELASDLGNLRLDELANSAALAGFLSERPSCDEPAAWYNGTVDDVGGRPERSAVWLSRNGCHEEIERRIWRAQLGVILPLVERDRLEIARRFSRSISLPFVRGDGTEVERLEDFEIGDLKRAIDRIGRAAPPSIGPYVKTLFDCRNFLAHQECVPTEKLTALVEGRRASRSAP